MNAEMMVNALDAGDTMIRQGQRPMIEFPRNRKQRRKVPGPVRLSATKNVVDCDYEPKVCPECGDKHVGFYSGDIEEVRRLPEDMISLPMRCANCQHRFTGLLIATTEDITMFDNLKNEWGW